MHKLKQIFTLKTIKYCDKSFKNTIDLVFLTLLLKNSLIIGQKRELKYGSDNCPIITQVIFSINQ